MKISVCLNGSTLIEYACTCIIRVLAQQYILSCKELFILYMNKLMGLTHLIKSIQKIGL
jgi:predicted membrane-bound dolichyl-phosphate-mannose-protein mannosyltransferase